MIGHLFSSPSLKTNWLIVKPTKLFYNTLKNWSNGVTRLTWWCKKTAWVELLLENGQNRYPYSSRGEWHETLYQIWSLQAMCDINCGMSFVRWVLWTFVRPRQVRSPVYYIYAISGGGLLMFTTVRIRQDVMYCASNQPRTSSTDLMCTFQKW